MVFANSVTKRVTPMKTRKRCVILLGSEGEGGGGEREEKGARLKVCRNRIFSQSLKTFLMKLWYASSFAHSTSHQLPVLKQLRVAPHLMFVIRPFRDWQRVRR
jgi:hypothetical protein